MELKWVIIHGKIGSKCRNACLFLSCLLSLSYFSRGATIMQKIMMEKGAYLFLSVGICFSVLYVSSIMNMVFCAFKEKCLFSEV